MPRCGCARWIVDSNATIRVAAAALSIRLPRHAALLKTRHNGVEAPAIHRCVALLENSAVLRMDIDYAGITKAELRGQRASYERNIVRKASLQYLAKTRNTFRV